MRRNKSKRLTAGLLSAAAALLLCAACQKKEDTAPAADFQEMRDKIQQAAAFQNASEEDAANPETAERYGLNANDVEAGFVYYDGDPESPDKIILIKAKDDDGIEHVEEALAAEIAGLTQTWRDNERMNKRVADHVAKTKNGYVLLAVAEDAKKIEKVFDEMFP